MAQDQKPLSVNFNIDPNKTKVLAVDSYLISNNQYAVTLNFAQQMPDPTQHNIVARVSMTKDQAKEFLLKLNEHIEKFEV